LVSSNFQVAGRQNIESGYSSWLANWNSNIIS
jgi:hypothetical protein